MHRATFTKPELTVWLAEQADLTWSRDASMPASVESFLKSLIAGKGFKNPVEIAMIPEECGIDSTHNGSRQRLLLLRHLVLQVRILNVDRGTKDRDGNNIKTTWQGISVATLVLE